MLKNIMLMNKKHAVELDRCQKSKILAVGEVPT